VDVEELINLLQCLRAYFEAERDVKKRSTPKGRI